MRRLRLLATSLRYSRPEQVARRIVLEGKRRALPWVARAIPLSASLEAEPRPALRPDLPRPAFPPRAGTAARGPRGALARVLGRDVPLGPPVDWRWPRELPGTRLERLTLHYHEFAEGLDDGTFQSVVADWIGASPAYSPGYWRDAWSSYAVSVRCVVWLQQLAARSGRLDRAFVELAARSIVAQLRFLAGNLELDIGGNHVIRNVKALLWGARCFHGDEAARWERRGVALLDREIEAQILPDGVHFERSPAYHLQVLADLVECAQVLPQGAVLDRLTGALESMAQAACDLTHPDGLPSLFNDGGLHMAYPTAACLDALARATGAAPRPRGVAALRDAGYFTARDGGDLVVVDCGALGPDELPAHAHGDALAFEWTLAGRRLAVDAGVYEYQGPLRPWSRATSSHNTVTIADRDQAEFWSSFRMARRPKVVLEAYVPREGGFSLTGSHDGYRDLAGRPVHRRRFDATPRSIEVEDTVEGGAGQPVRARILLHPDAAVERLAGGAVLRCGPARARLTTAAPFEAIEATWCPDFGVKIDTRQIVIEYGPAPCSGGFRLEAVAADR